MQKLSKNTHLSEEETIKKGSFYTPSKIVDIVVDWTNEFVDNQTAIFDFGVGYGAFISQYINTNAFLFATDSDSESIKFVNNNFPSVRTFLENSLLDASRNKYGLDKNQKIVVVGNPPYNDVTSLYKKGNKGTLECDEDVLSRDLGVSFLKMYDKLSADIVCVLHPLSYLIKKNNFNSLGAFKDNYKLIKGTIFSSKLFENIKSSSSEFPVVVALYARELGGMKSFDYIQNFVFGIVDSERTFCLNSFNTIDGKIGKYPTKDKKDTDLQFYTIRDINALKRNATFLVGNCPNGIKVNIDNLYQYAWLDYFKSHFNPKDEFLYGNLSPFYSSDIEKPEVKNELIRYILFGNDVVKNYDANNDHIIFKSYNIDAQKVSDGYPLLEEIINHLY